MKNLIVVESPTKARTLSRFLGKDYSVEATMGHIKDLPKSKLGVDVVRKFAPDYVVVEKRDKEINRIKSEAKKADVIYLATDPDREGEAIAQHVAEILSSTGRAGKTSRTGKNKSDALKRIVFHEITKSAVEKAIGEPKSIDKNLVNAQIARRVLDRLVGYKLSPLLWKKVRRGLSAGRVQTVVVKLIVEKEREIEAFKADEYWEISCRVQGTENKEQGSEFAVRLTKINEKKVEIKDGKTAKEVVTDLEKSKYSIFDVKKREVKKSPYPPFTTSTMTQAAARLFHWSVKRTMSIAQKLYEEGLITYHRTDSVHLAKPAVNKARSFIKKEYGDNYAPENLRFYKTKSKSAQEAHEAIRPTKVGMTNDKLPMTNGKFQNDAKKLYELIWKRFVACQMADSVYDETRIEVNAKCQMTNAKLYALRASGQIMKFDGWRKIMPLSKNEEPQLPNVEKNDPLRLIKVDPQQKFTQPPARFNEASLIKTLEKLGIGRPSTYAPTISTIQVRQYVEKNEGKFKPTLVGFAVNDFLVKHFPKIFEYEFTAEMENSLDHVAGGVQKWEEMMADFYKPFEKKLVVVEEKSKRVKIETEKLGKKCPDCKKGLPAGRQGELVIRIGRFGKFISCSEFPECKHTEKYLEKIGMKCPDCKKSLPVGRQGDIIVKTTKKRRKFFGCSLYPKCKWASWKNPKEKKAAS